MKKLIFLILVLGTASAANAMTLHLTPDLDAETLDIVDTEGYTVGDDIYWALVGNPSYITFSGGTVDAVAPLDTEILGYDAQANGMCEAPYDGVWGFIGSIAGTSTGPGTYIDGIDYFFHVQGGDEISWVRLIGTTDFIEFTELDAIMIFVPEPMTLALLGLGGLMLLRRRRR
jgi:hypothetical protein